MTEEAKQLPRFGKYVGPRINGQRIKVYASNPMHAAELGRKKVAEIVGAENKYAKPNTTQDVIAATLYFTHTLTELDLEANPALKKQGLKAGDVVQIPSEKAKTEEEADKKTPAAKKAALIASAKALGVDPYKADGKPHTAKRLEQLIAKAKEAGAIDPTQA